MAIFAHAETRAAWAAQTSLRSLRKLDCGAREMLHARNYLRGALLPTLHASLTVRSQVAGGSDPAPHAHQVARDRDVRDASDQIFQRDRTVREGVTRIDAVSAIIAKHEHVPSRDLRFRHIG